jgi:asparaginyl-tRNA synthetase
LEIQEQLVYFIIQEVLRTNRQELGFLDRDVAKLEIIKPEFLRKRYVDVIAELQAMGSDIKE